MKKFLLSFFVIFIFAFYVVFTRNSEPIYISPSSSLTPESAAGNKESSREKATAVPQPSKNYNRIYKDGSYTGNIADAYYGNVQVKITIKNGLISDVEFLDYPHDRRTSIEINSQAMPYLKTESIRAQSAQVDIVSGATQTSEAFIESLASALTRAKN